MFLSAKRDFAAYHKKYSDLPQLDWGNLDRAREEILNKSSQAPYDPGYVSENKIYR